MCRHLVNGIHNIILEANEFAQVQIAQSNNGICEAILGRTISRKVPWSQKEVTLID